MQHAWFFAFEVLHKALNTSTVANWLAGADLVAVRPGDQTAKKIAGGFLVGTI